jgi:hypothetical protein
VAAPEVAQPTIVSADESTIVLRYELRDPGQLRVGIGTMEFAYWEGKLVEPSHAVVTLDAERAVPLSEEVFTADGDLGARISYDEWERLPDGSRVPLRILIDAPELHVAARNGHMEYVLRYQIVGRDTWLLANATATELMAGGNQLRAYTSFDDPAVDR